jgi:hypothetical protein
MVTTSDMVETDAALGGRRTRLLIGGRAGQRRDHLALTITGACAP